MKGEPLWNRLAAAVEPQGAPQTETGQAKQGPEVQAALTLFTAGLCLLGIHYLKFSTTFQALLTWIAASGNADGIAAIRDAPAFALLTHCWWAAWHVIGYLLVPMAVIRWVFRQPMAEYGWRSGALKHHIHWYLLLGILVMTLALGASGRSDFTVQYPFYPLAHRSWADFAAWELLYLVQFLCLEFFFRGFLINGCYRAFRFNAVMVMAVPYMMIHFAKPWLEASGAIVFGIILGVLALRSRSIWGGVAVHGALAVTMDIAALLRTHGLPGTLWP